MIQCPVCSHQNDDLALRCTSCGSNVQERVPTLDFFSTFWMMVEYPGKALKRIIMAEHKNYVLMLAMFFGISAAFALSWAVKAGNMFENVAHLILAASLIGIVMSMPLFFVIVGLLHAAGRAMGGRGSWRNTYAAAGWALCPFAFATVVVQPIELAAFGLMFFSNNPHPFEVKPLAYSVLIGIDGLIGFWSIVLAVSGIAIAHALPKWKSAAAVFAVLTAVSAVLYGAAKMMTAG